MKEKCEQRPLTLQETKNVQKRDKEETTFQEKGDLRESNLQGKGDLPRHLGGLISKTVISP